MLRNIKNLLTSDKKLLERTEFREFEFRIKGETL